MNASCNKSCDISISCCVPCLERLSFWSRVPCAAVTENRLDSYICDVTHSYKTRPTYACHTSSAATLNEPCHLWTSCHVWISRHVTYGWTVPCLSQVTHISHITRMNESCHVCLIHSCTHKVPCAAVAAYTHDSRIRDITHSYVTGPMYVWHDLCMCDMPRATQFWRGVQCAALPNPNARPVSAHSARRRYSGENPPPNSVCKNIFENPPNVVEVSEYIWIVWQI